MKKLIYLFAIVMTACTAKEKTLQEAYKDYFTVGVAVSQRSITDSATVQLIKQQFNSLTAENDMKPQVTHPEENRWNWRNADAIANFARENNIALRGHTLIWHGQTGRWMFYDDNGELVSKEVLFQRMRTHIHTVVGRYKGQIYAWDVVNEAMTDDANAEIPYRTRSPYWEICGSDEFIRKAFEYAREADPDALLFYNDYNETVPHKRERIYNMVKEMKAAGVPIDGIGMQGHYNINSPTEDEFRTALARYSEVVDHIHVTELDVRVNAGMGGQMQGEEGQSVLTPELNAKQVAQYGMLFRVLREYNDKVDNVTFWNTDDAHTWLDGRQGSSRRSFPLLFDDNLKPKDSYYEVVNF